ncbi:hypothetical protein E2320_020584 [Naja naja]|nr:hypothetical protein E2320_020584 [Naja naja]
MIIRKQWATRTQEGIPEATQDAAAAKQTKLSVISHFLYVLSDPNKLQTGSSSIDLLDENWAYGRNEQSRRYLAKMIQHFPSRGILEPGGTSYQLDVDGSFWHPSTCVYPPIIPWEGILSYNR